MDMVKNLSECTPTESIYYAIFHRLPEHDIAKENLPQLLAVIDGLTPREKSIIRMEFGIATQKHATLKEIGEAIGVSESSTGRARHKAIRKLRHPLRANPIKRAFDMTQAS